MELTSWPRHAATRKSAVTAANYPSISLCNIPRWSASSSWWVRWYAPFLTPTTSSPVASAIPTPSRKMTSRAASPTGPKTSTCFAPRHAAAQKRLLDLLTAKPQDMTHSDYALPTQPALHRLKEIRVPTLILVGDANIPDVHAHAVAIEAGIAGSRRVVITDAGHLMYLEQPEEFSR